MLRSFGGHEPKVHPRAFVHAAAELIGRVELADGASVWPFAVLRGDVDLVRIGGRSNVQDLTVMHGREGRPVLVGRGVTVGHRAILHGARVGDGCLVGMGAVVMEAEIGRECLVGAGAMILAGARFAARRLILGSPARAVRPLSARELASLRSSAAGYAALARRHLRTSRVL